MSYLTNQLKTETYRGYKISFSQRHNTYGWYVQASINEGNTIILGKDKADAFDKMKHLLNMFDDYSFWRGN